MVASSFSAPSELAASLRRYRIEQSILRSILPSNVFGDKLLSSIVASRPSSLPDLGRLPGFGVMRVNRYGNDIVRLVHLHSRPTKARRRRGVSARQKTDPTRNAMHPEAKGKRISKLAKGNCKEKRTTKTAAQRKRGARVIRPTKKCPCCKPDGEEGAVLISGKRQTAKKTSKKAVKILGGKSKGNSKSKSAADKAPTRPSCQRAADAYGDAGRGDAPVVRSRFFPSSAHAGSDPALVCLSDSRPTGMLSSLLRASLGSSLSLPGQEDDGVQDNSQVIPHTNLQLISPVNPPVNPPRKKAIARRLPDQLRPSVYVLELEDGRVYVGSSRDVDRRISQHVAGSGSAYTRVYRPTGVRLPRLGNVEGDGDAAERDETLRYMMLRGIPFVRGWKFARVDMQPEEIAEAEANIRELFDLCRRCGYKGHFCTQCTATYDRFGQRIVPV